MNRRLETYRIARVMLLEDMVRGREPVAYDRCDSCGASVPTALLDSQPSDLVNWERLLCIRCYGPDYCTLDGSVQPVRGWRATVLQPLASLMRRAGPSSTLVRLCAAARRSWFALREEW